MEFAAKFPKTDEGWIDFPSDVGYRKSIFPEDIAHPARANLHMVEAIVEYVSQPEETVMDIMAGAGSIAIAAVMGRKVVCIEIEKIYQDTLAVVKNHLSGEVQENLTLLFGDCRDFLPFPVNHIIFSPPYARILKTKQGAKQDSTKQLAGVSKHSEFGSWSPEYSTNPRNVGNLNKFLYNQTMERIYKLCYDSLFSGGTMTVILKDYIHKGKRVYLSDWLTRTCIKMGFEITGWHKRKALGTGFLKLWRSRGCATVSDEDIIIFNKE